MGVSTDAILAFGIDLGEELPEAWESSEGSFDFNDLIYAESGLIRPEPAVRGSPEMRIYYDDRVRVEQAFPVDLIWHCSYDYPMYFLAVRGTEIKANRGYPSSFNGSHLAISEKQMSSFKAFCEKHGIEWKEPHWHIFSMWG